MKHTLASSIFAAVFGLSVGSFFVGIASAQTAPVKLRFGHAHPVTDSQHVAALEFAKKVKERTQGGIEIQVFPSNQLGNDNTMIAGVRGGTIDIIVSGSGNFAGLVPLMGIFDIPFMFKDTAHAYRVLDGKPGQDMLDKLGEFNMKGLAYWDNGWRQMSNSKHPINTPADVKGLKMRTTGSPAHIEAFRLLGANPVPMPLAELYTALEMKTVDAQEHPIGVLWSAKLYEVQKHLSLTYHAYSALIVVMNKAKFDALPPAHQKALVEAAREAGQYQRQLNNENIAKITADVKKAGMQVVEKVDGTPFLAATKPGRDTFTAKFGGADIIKAIDAVRDTK